MLQHLKRLVNMGSSLYRSFFMFVIFSLNPLHVIYNLYFYNMIKIGNFQDDILGEESYDLYSCKLSTIKKLVLDAVQSKVNFKVEDYDSGKESQHLVERSKMKVPSFYHNNFIVVQGLEDGSPWLLDGFTRLFIASDHVKDINVFVKSYSKNMKDDKVMSLLASLNFWKTQQYTHMMFDRGFTLYTFMKTGCNIKNYNQEISFYLDSRINTVEYKYQSSKQIDLQNDLVFKNPHIFEDMVTICKLHDVTFDATQFLQKRKDKKEYVKKDLKFVNYAVPFYRIVGSLRIVNICENTNHTIDVKDATEWLLNNSELQQLAVENTHSCNSTSETNTAIKSKEIFWNKYILPIVLKKEEVKTTEELKEEFRKTVNKEKNKYVKITYEDLLKAEPGLEIFNIYASYPTLKVDKKVYIGHKTESFTYTPNIGFMVDRKPRTTVSDVFMFKKEGEEKIEETSRESYRMKETMLILKVKK